MPRNKTSNIKIGPLGESVACKFLRGRGFSIIERNYRKAWGEIDIIAEKKGKIHFFEVKAVSYEPSGTDEGIAPAENLHQEKVKRVMRTIHSYIGERRIPKAMQWQLDAALLSIDVPKREARIEILENIGS